MASQTDYEAANILDNLRNINKNNTLLDVLLEFEKILEDQGLYAFKNWKTGEIISGPELSRYWIDVKLMYDYNNMPDPGAIPRLTDIGCKISFKKGNLKSPVTPKSYDDLDEYNKPKMQSHSVWIVSVKMPRKLVDDFKDEHIKLSNDSIDMEDLNKAYDQGLDDKTRIAQQGKG
jgi:hypothetical protein